MSERRERIAMVVLASYGGGPFKTQGMPLTEYLAKSAVAQADALIRELDNGTEQR